MQVLMPCTGHPEGNLAAATWDFVKNVSIGIYINLFFQMVLIT